MAPVRAVIFDLGHTLWDYAPREGTRRSGVLRLRTRLAAALNGPPPEPQALDRELVAAAVRQIERWNSDELEQPPSEALVREALNALGVAVAEDVLRELTAIFFGPETDISIADPQTMSTIAELDQRGLAMGCVTNTITTEPGICETLRRLGLPRYLRSVVVSSAMGFRKPHPSLFLRALKELGVPPAEAVFVGDRLTDDIGGAQAVGMRAVLTHEFRQETPDETTPRPDALIQRLSELPPVLDRFAGEP